MLVQGVFLSLLSVLACATAGNVLLDASGGLRLKFASELSRTKGVVAVVTSPGTSSFLSASSSDDHDDTVLSLDESEKSCVLLTCRGATLKGTSANERNSLATTSLIADVILVDGIIPGDVEAGWKNSRHARTLTALFRARVTLALGDTPKQTLLLCVRGEVTEADESSLLSDVQTLFEAIAVETDGKGLAMNDMYDVKVVSVMTEEQASEVR